MIVDLRRRFIGGLVIVSIRQIAGVAIAAGGGIILARLLGLHALGLYAVSAFVVGVAATLMELGMHQFIIQEPRARTGAYLETLVVVRLMLILAVQLLVLMVVAPLASYWYESQDLYWLIVLGSIASGIGAFFRISVSLLEANLQYQSIGIVEVVAVAAFYLPASVGVWFGGGVVFLGVADLCRGVAMSLAYWIRPFSVRLRFDREAVSTALRFGGTYTASVLTWMATSGLNPIVIARIAGLEAVAVVRLADGIVGNVSVLKTIVDRVAYPAFAQIAGDRARVARAVVRGRSGELLAGLLPLAAFTAVSPWVIPAVYGSAWQPVAFVLPLACIALALNTMFGLYSNALLARGRSGDVFLFHVIYVGSLWLLTPIFAFYFEYLALALAAIAGGPAYWILHRAFSAEFGNVEYGPAVRLALGIVAVSIFAWSAPTLGLALGIFGIGSGALAMLLKSARADCIALYSEVVRKAPLPVGSRDVETANAD